MGIVRPHLWYHSQAIEAAEFYVSVIPSSSVTSVVEAPVDMPGVAAGTPFIVEFVLDGMPVTAISAGPHFTLDEAFSFYLTCRSQAEVDHYWDVLLSDGGEPSRCGWLKDRFGVSWQVVPVQLEEILGRGDEGAARAAQAMLQMGKIDIAALESAYADATS